MLLTIYLFFKNFREGYCRFEDYVVLENLETVRSLTLCQQACQHRPNCEFFVYEKKDHICHLQGGVKRDCDIVHGLPEPSFAGCLTDNKIPFKSSGTSPECSQTNLNLTHISHWAIDHEIWSKRCFFVSAWRKIVKIYIFPHSKGVVTRPNSAWTINIQSVATISFLFSY